MSTSLYAVVDPSTGELVKEYPTATDEQIEQAIAVAAKAHREWSRTSSVADRAALIRRVAELHEERKDDLAKIIQREMGKPLDQSVGEVEFSAAIYTYYADNAEKFLADEPIELLEGDGSALIRRSSVGVLLGIMPWNYPYYQVARFAGPNLVTGNTIVLKHAPQCPESAAALQQIFLDAGYPEGAYVNVYATNEQIADAIADPRVQGVSLTGSERAGAAVAEIAGRNLKKVVLELGGSDPFILLSTDDLDSTVEAAIDGRFENTGQACNAAKRIIVAEDVYDEFVDKFTKKVLEKADGLAPLSSVAAAERLDDQVKRAVDDGANLITDGQRKGAFFPPGVLTGVSPDSPTYREELFGPVATVYKVANEDEAVELANDTPFGLGSYVFTTDDEQARRVADRIDAGMVFV
ncbi:MAG: NAD-dependent succinate-semialdehyde dehydrogenase, partial [Mycolicibacterium sp.]|nr:NAD-dependent succinate-semialdehyde dehydrogenase [Mycolicibacterium sp.]